MTTGNRPASTSKKARASGFLLAGSNALQERRGQVIVRALWHRVGHDYRAQLPVSGEFTRSLPAERRKTTLSEPRAAGR